MTASTGCRAEVTKAGAYRASEDALRAGDQVVLRWPVPWRPVPDATGAGVFLSPPTTGPGASLVLPLGTLDGLARFTSLHRYSPYWTRPAVGTSHTQIAPETLWLLAETGPGRFTMVVPLLDGATRYALRVESGLLAVSAETGDPATPVTDGPAVFMAVGCDPYTLVAAGARAVQARLGGGRLRKDKPVPDIADLFGWCTWDAFYKDVSEQKVLDGLASFERAGVPPRFVIVDDGWQQWRRAASGEDRLVDLAPNDRFGGDLSTLVRAAKTRFGVQRVLVWHALLGYWGGLDDAAFSRYGTRSVARSFGPGLLEQEPRLDTRPWGSQVGVPAHEHLAAFYDDLHASLAAQGVDGVKVDVQAVVEAVAAGQGGRVALARATRHALEGSVARHFGGRLVNCMSCTSECAYLCADSTLMRTSDDFFPQQPGSHGAHLHCNALASLWFGEFMLPDWDMFQSAHSHGAFHAAARAVSGGPVYVSDRVGIHDAALLRKLVLSDGTVLRADGPGRPSPDVLLADPTSERVLLKIFNRNRDRGVVGLFNAGNGCGDVQGSVGLGDVPVLDATGDFVAWSHQGNRLWRCRDEPRASVTLAEAGWEIVSFAPVERDFAVLGLADKFNSGGAVSRYEWLGDTCLIEVRDGGALLAWAVQSPVDVRCDGMPLAFVHDRTDGRLAIDVPTGGRRHLSVAWS